MPQYKGISQLTPRKTNLDTVDVFDQGTLEETKAFTTGVCGSLPRMGSRLQDI